MIENRPCSMIYWLVESVELSILTGLLASTHGSRNYTVLTVTTDPADPQLRTGNPPERLLSRSPTRARTYNSARRWHNAVNWPEQVREVTAYERSDEISDPYFGVLSRGAMALGAARLCRWPGANEAGDRRAQRFQPYRGCYPDTARSDHRIQFFDGQQPLRSAQDFRRGGGQRHRYRVRPGRLAA